MEVKKNSKELLKELYFTSREIADYTGVTEGMIKKVRSWHKKAGSGLEENIRAFVKSKIEKVLALL